MKLNGRIGLVLAAVFSAFGGFGIPKVATAGVSGNIQCVESSCYISNLKLYGEINADALDEIQKLVNDARSSTGVEKRTSDMSGVTIHLNSPGGSIDAAIKIGRLLRKERIGAMILPNEICVSACVLIYAGAVSRFGRNPSTRLGIHRPYFDFKRTSASSISIKEQYDKMHGDIAVYLKEVNVSTRLLEDMMKIPPDSVRYLSDNDQDDYGLDIIDPVEREVMDVEEARKMRISRTELIRRQKWVKEVCFDRKFDPACFKSIMENRRNDSAPDLSEFGTLAK